MCVCIYVHIYVCMYRAGSIADSHRPYNANRFQAKGESLQPNDSQRMRIS